MSHKLGSANSELDGGISLLYYWEDTKFSVQTLVTTSIADVLPPENPKNHMAPITRIEEKLKKRPKNIDDIKKTMTPQVFDLLIRDFPDMLMLPPKNPENMAWYQEFISRESHPNYNRTKWLIIGLSENTAAQEQQMLQYARDYENFFERWKSCTAKITLKWWPLFVQFSVNERQRFQDMVGLIPEELLDTSRPDNIFLYSMSEAT